mgnify:CR=1 FL=1
MMKIFENWTFTRILPEPFAGVAANRGKKDTTEASCLSVHNHMSRMKRATLHASTLKALLAVSAIIRGDQEGAFGVQTVSGTVKWYCMEYAKPVAAGSEIRIGVYHPQDGKWKGIVKNGTTLAAYPQIGERGASGREIIMMFIFASLAEGSLHDDEFSKAFLLLNDEIKNGYPDADKATDLAFLCCDNLYRRIVNSASLGESGILFDGDSIASGNVPLILTSQLADGDYNPTETIYGKFQVLECKDCERTIAELKEPSQCRQLLIDSIKEQMDVGETAYEFEDQTSVVMVIGVNGVGKTTTIGKLAGKLRAQNKKVVLAAADTFRAAAGEQLKEWASRAQADLIGGQEGSDPASVVYDAVAAAKARHADVLLCDTAGRLHNKKNLMEELKKMNRIIDREYPEAFRETLVVLDATTGQNALQQAREFNEVADITGIILTKMDGTAKGGIAVAIQAELGIPVKYIGVGETIEDLQKFDADTFVNALFQTSIE